MPYQVAIPPCPLRMFQYITIPEFGYLSFHRFRPLRQSITNRVREHIPRNPHALCRATQAVPAASRASKPTKTMHLIPLSVTTSIMGYCPVNPVNKKWGSSHDRHPLLNTLQGTWSSAKPDVLVHVPFHTAL